MSAQQDGFGSSNSGSTSTKERVADAASTTLATASDATKNVVGEATGQTKAVVGEAKAQAQQLISSTRSEFQTQADDRARQAAEHLRGMSTSITALLNGRPGEAAQMTGYLQQAQSRIDGIASRIETGGPQGVIDDLTSFARRRPGAFLFVAGVAGFAIGRAARAGAAAAHDELAQPAMLQPGGW
ncbi:MAG: hypothetical protein JWN99_1122 [Ilumatobacteraceae bacterium]|nr:hypothetical protein [Ilumatobacteraceae bacterium]